MWQLKEATLRRSATARATAILHFYDTHSVLPLAFYTTFGKRRQSMGAACGCQSFSGSALSGRYKGTLCASDSRIFVMPALASLAFPCHCAVMASPRNGASREESATTISSRLSPAKSYLSLLEIPNEHWCMGSFWHRTSCPCPACPREFHSDYAKLNKHILASRNNTVFTDYFQNLNNFSKEFCKEWISYDSGSWISRFPHDELGIHP